MWAILKTNSLFGHYRYVRRFFRHSALLAAFTFQDSYLSLHPYHAQSIYSLFTYSELCEGSFLPVGGMYEITKMLVKIAKKLGVKIVCQQPVEKINILGKQTTGVTLVNGQKMVADVVVVNADIGYSYAHLLPDRDLAREFKRKKYSCSAVVFHWGLDKKYSQFHTHNLFFGPNYKQGFDQVLASPTPPSNPHFYVQVPTRIDHTRAPKNSETLSVMVPINHLDPKHPVDWQSYAKSLRIYILSRLKAAGYIGIDKHIKFEKRFLPTDWENYFNLTKGSIYGLDHNLWQMGYFRPRRLHSRYRNVYFVGSGTHPGSGLPTVLLSAQHTSSLVSKNLG